MTCPNCEYAEGLKALLRAARCPDPNCDGKGVVANQVADDEWEPHQCQWCDERETLLNNPAAPSVAQGEDRTEAWNDRALARAIAEAAKRAGIYNGEVPLTGPQLIQLCDDLASSHAIDNFQALADLARRSHYYCEDPWYSCPLAEDGCANEVHPADKCNCGADEHNAKVDALIAAHKGHATFTNTKDCDDDPRIYPYRG